MTNRRSLRRSLAVLAFVALVPLAACKGKADDKAGDKPLDPAGAGVTYADVDCDKMIDHVGDLLLRESMKGKTDAELADGQAKMKAQHATMVDACVKEKPTKKLTQKQYDCIMAAHSGADMQACQ